MTARLYEKYYYSRPGFVGGTPQFHAFCRDRICPGARILEIGAGPANGTSTLLARIGPVTGVDISREILENRAMTEAYVYDGRSLPLADGSFDACVSNYVLEHVADPAAHFGEVRRVLKPGGIYILRTPNLRHYVSIAARVLRNAWHGIANPLRGRPAGTHEPWPTFHRCNTVSKIKGLGQSQGLAPVEIRMVEKEPSYGCVHPLLFYPMMAYERCVNRFATLAPFRSNIVMVLEKPDITIPRIPVADASRTSRRRRA